MLEIKHQAFLTELERRGQPDTGELALCFQVLSLASAIDQDCASRLAPLGLSEGRFVLLFLLRGADTALSPHQLAERAGVTFQLGESCGAIVYGDKLGLTTNLTKSLNDAGGKAAGEAKPIFRSAINNLRWSDAPALVSKQDGATRYLQTSAADTLFGKVSPLVGSALDNVGAYRQLDQLAKGNSLMASAGLTRDGLTRSVTEQALKGIFHYMAGEEAALRRNPAGLLKGIF